MTTTHNHSFGFGEEACEICGMPFIEAQDDSIACPGAKPETAFASDAAARIKHLRYDKRRQSIIRLFAHTFRRITY